MHAISRHVLGTSKAILRDTVRRLTREVRTLRAQLEALKEVVQASKAQAQRQVYSTVAALWSVMDKLKRQNDAYKSACFGLANNLTGPAGSPLGVSMGQSVGMQKVSSASLQVQNWGQQLNSKLTALDEQLRPATHSLMHHQSTTRLSDTLQMRLQSQWQKTHKQEQVRRMVFKDGEGIGERVRLLLQKYKR